MLYPRDPVPPFEARSLDAGTWRLSEQCPRTFTVIVVYRGYQCPFCKAHLTSLNEHIAALEEMGIETFVVSAESEDRVQKARDDWGLDLNMGYGLDPAMGHKWGLYLSEFMPEGATQPELFFEPGLFLITGGDEKTLYYTSIQNMPFGRPEWGQFVNIMGKVVGADYPARGYVKLEA